MKAERGCRPRLPQQDCNYWAKAIVKLLLQYQALGQMRTARSRQLRLVSIQSGLFQPHPSRLSSLRVRPHSRDGVEEPTGERSLIWPRRPPGDKVAGLTRCPFLACRHSGIERYRCYASGPSKSARLVVFDPCLVGQGTLPRGTTARLAPSFFSRSMARKGP